MSQQEEPDSAPQEESTGATYDQASIFPTFVFGLNPKASDSIIHVDTNHVLSPAGRYVAISALDSPEMSFIQPKDSSTKGVTAMTISPNRKYLAIGERTSGQVGRISLVNLSTMEVQGALTFSESREIISLAFSGDGRFLAAQTGRPDWALVCWDWDSVSIVSTVKIQHPVTKVSFNPWDTKFLVTSGRRHLQLWKMVGQTFQATALAGLVNAEERNWSHHVWLLGDVLVACTDAGEVLVFERGTLKQTIPPFHGEFGVTCMATLTKGVVAAGGSNVSILESLEEGGQGGFVVKRTFKVPAALCVRGEISSLSIPLSETNVVCGTTTSQMFQLTLDLSAMTIDVGQPLADHIFGQHKGVHNGGLTGLDVAVRKPLAVSVGVDSSVRVFNYATRKCELAKFFKEDAVSIAVHPMGTFVAVGFTDKLKICSVLVDDIRIEAAFAVKSCREVRFSNGGHLIAAVAQNGVQIYSAVTHTHVATLRGHVGQVKAIAFSRDDRRLVTVSIDGAIFEWSTQTWQRIQDNVVKTCAYTAVGYDDTGTAIVCASSDKMLRQIVDGKITQQVSSGSDVITALVFSERHRAVFAGTASGFLRIFEFPLTGAFREYPVHSASVARLRLSPGDESFLFSAGEDGCLFAFMISSLAAAGAATSATDMSMPKRESTAADENKFLDLTLAGQSWMREVFAEQRNTLARMEKVAQSVEAEVTSRMAAFRAEVEKATAEHEGQLKEERKRVEELLTHKAEAEAKHAEDTKSIMAAHAATLKEAEEARKKAAAEMGAKVEELGKERDKAEKTWKEKIEAERKRHDEQVAALRAEQAKELEAQRAKYAALEQKLHDEQELHEAEIRQQEEEYEYALAQAKEKASFMLQIERDSTGTLERVGSQVKRRLEESLKEQSALRGTVDRLEAELERVQTAVKEKEEECANLKRDLAERSETVAQKEGRLSELKGKNQELEKFRYVLEYKIAELKDQLGPHETTIAAQKEQISAMNEELQRTLSKLEEMRLRHAEHTLKVDAANRQLVQAKAQLAEKDKYVKALIESVHRVYAETDSAAWKAGFTALYQTYVTEQASKAVTAEDQDRMAELARQREFTEHSLEVLKTKEGRSEYRHRVDLDRRTTENIQLINEMNRLRRENRELVERIVTLQNKLDSGSIKATERVRAKVAAEASVAVGSAKKTKRGSPVGRSPNSAPSASALAHPRQVDAGASAEAEFIHLEQLLEQKDRTIEQLKQEMDRLAGQLAVLTTDFDRGVATGTSSTTASLRLSRTRPQSTRSDTEVPTTGEDVKLPQIKP